MLTQMPLCIINTCARYHVATEIRMSMWFHNSVEYSWVFVDNQLIECAHCTPYPSHLPVLHNVHQLSST